MDNTFSSAHIKKIDEDRYHFTLQDRFRLIDEEIDGPKLMAMLGREQLIGTTVDDVLARLDPAEIGFEIAVNLRASALA
jgi:hypothetical protein